MAEPRRASSLGVVDQRWDLGGSPFSLQGVTPEGTLRLVRPLEQHEFDVLSEAAGAARLYLFSNAFLLTYDAEVKVYAAIETVLNSGAVRFRPLADLPESYVAWLLLFSMTLDHWEGEINSRYGSASPESTARITATNTAYDGHSGYRFASGARDRVAHRRLPDIGANPSRYAVDDGQIDHGGTVTVGTAWLREWASCPRLLKNDLAVAPDRLELAPLVADAMEGLEEVRRTAEPLVFPEAPSALRCLRQLAAEAAPDTPCLLRLREEKPDGALAIELVPLHDLLDRLSQVS